jgi:uncharacterized small protein (DUF1192 family)
MEESIMEEQAPMIPQEQAPELKEIESIKIQQAVQKKQEEVKTKDTVKKSGQFDFKVELYDVFGGITKKATTIEVINYRENGNLYLYNEKLKFKEIKPETTEDFKLYSIAEIDTQIDKLNNELSKIKNKESNNNQKDILFTMRVLNGYKRSLVNMGEGSFCHIDDDKNGGRITYRFLRVGNYKLPMFTNIETNTILVLSESKIAEASTLLDENEKKNGKSQVTLISIVLIIILCVLVIVFIYAIYKASSMPDVCTTNLDMAMKVWNTTGSIMSENAERLMNLSDKLTITQDVNIVTPNIK